MPRKIRKLLARTRIGKFIGKKKIAILKPHIKEYAFRSVNERKARRGLEEYKDLAIASTRKLRDEFGLSNNEIRILLKATTMNDIFPQTPEHVLKKFYPGSASDALEKYFEFKEAVWNLKRSQVGIKFQENVRMPRSKAKKSEALKKLNKMRRRLLLPKKKAHEE